MVLQAARALCPRAIEVLAEALHHKDVRVRIMRRQLIIAIATTLPRCLCCGRPNDQSKPSGL
jgi:hypothetical protein